MRLLALVMVLGVVLTPSHPTLSSHHPTEMTGTEHALASVVVTFVGRLK